MAEENKTQTPVKSGVETVKCKVYSLSLIDKKSPIFVSINSYCADIPQNVEVTLPKQVVKFLQSATQVKHIVEKGKTVSVNEPLYVVTVLD